jgi:predicted DCC family thiol-disulfide oxidoreductase YuxK
MTNHPIVFYDGVCGLCDRSVQFVIKRDKKRVFRYATLQSEFAHQVLGENITFDSFVLYDKGKVYFRSSAALKTFSQLTGLWPLTYVLMIIPPFIRNGVYDFIASHRYKWFGKFDSCKIPTAAQKELFLDESIL